MSHNQYLTITIQMAAFVIVRSKWKTVQSHLRRVLFPSHQVGSRGLNFRSYAQAHVEALCFFYPYFKIKNTFIELKKFLFLFCIYLVKFLFICLHSIIINHSLQHFTLKLIFNYQKLSNLESFILNHYYLIISFHFQ